MVSVPIDTPRHRGAVLAGAYALVGSIGLLTLVGAFVALAMLGGGSASAAHEQDHVAATGVAQRQTRTDDLGESIPTSFGVIAAENVNKLVGLTPKQLGGMTHYPSYMAPNLMQVQVFVELSNTQRHAVAYAPQQFRLVVGSGRPIPLSNATLPVGTMQPSAAVEGQLTFIAPRRTRAGSHLWLEFRDPGAAKPVRVDLGSAQTRGHIPAASTYQQGHLDHQHPPP